MVAAVGAFIVFRHSGVSGKEDTRTAEASIRQQTESTLGKWASYRSLKTFYPQDHARIVEAVTGDVLRGVPLETALEHASRMQADIKRREAKNYSMASIASLREDLRTGCPCSGT